MPDKAESPDEKQRPRGPDALTAGIEFAQALVARDVGINRGCDPGDSDGKSRSLSLTRSIFGMWKIPREILKSRTRCEGRELMSENFADPRARGRLLYVFSAGFTARRAKKA